MEDHSSDASPFEADRTHPLLSQEDWQQVDYFLDKLLQVPQQDRQAHLVKLNIEADAIRRQVEMLLALSNAGDDTFLKPLTSDAGRGSMLNGMAASLKSEQIQPGAQIGNYTIVRPIGKGGMGIVYLAERAFDKYKKPVALKVVKRGMDTDDIIRRFRFERQILAGLEHANIARLLDGGVTDHGLPYFVMEYVSGLPIDQYCDTNKLSVQERLSLFKTVCEAVQFAHRNLVVHRDLKPANVLVTHEGQVKLLDFGIAKVLDTSEPGTTMYVTEDHARRMTPEYASPEQIRGDTVTTATDVYALGVILYELLSGRRPYRFKNRLVKEFEEKICQEVPGRPSTMSNRDFPDVEIKSIEISSLRATQPDRLRRQLAGDLDAITLKALKKEPHLRYYSAGDFAEDINRHLLHLPVQARRDSARYRVGKFVRRYKWTVAAASLAVVALLSGIIGTTWAARQAQAALAVANEERDRKEEVNAFYTAMLSTFNPNTTEEYALARGFMQGGIDKLDQLDDQPLMQAVVMNALGEFSRQFRLYGMADSLYKEALALQRVEGLPGTHPDLIESLNGVGRVLMMQRKYEQAELIFKDTIDRNPSIADSYINLGFVYLMTGKIDQAIEVFLQVIEIEPDNVKATNNLGIAYFYAKQWDEARMWTEKALAISPTFVSYLNLATLYYYHEGRYADAAVLYRKALDLNDKDYSLWGNFATATYWAPGERAKSTALFNIAIDKAKKRLDEFDGEDHEALSQLATYLVMVGDQEGGFNAIQRAYQMASTDGRVLMRLGFIYERMGNRAEAIDWIEKALVNGYPMNNIEGDPGFESLRRDDSFEALRASFASQ